MKHRTPEPSIWPVTLAVGVAIAVIGVLTSWVLTLGGAVVVGVGLFGWIAQTLREAAP